METFSFVYTRNEFAVQYIYHHTFREKNTNNASSPILTDFLAAGYDRKVTQHSGLFHEAHCARNICELAWPYEKTNIYGGIIDLLLIPDQEKNTLVSIMQTGKKIGY